MFARKAARVRAALRLREDDVFARFGDALLWTITGVSSVPAPPVDPAAADWAAAPPVTTIKPIKLTAPMSRQRPTSKTPTANFPQVQTANGCSRNNELPQQFNAG
ncbi:hypothetical protein [Bradyrhizobium sp.]|uniref:hypothetical protein n=1 Tax=Bradyrhizobium sp. TaxID=376 RepID=UPI0025C52705|nr:hypothetical protein [Bradyrhizobium sp.]